MKNKKLLSLLLLLLASCNPYITTPTATLEPTMTARPAPLITATARATPTAEAQTAIVKAAAINVRQSPDGEVIAVLNAGNTVQIVVCRGNWCQIKEPVEGWLWRGCLRELAGKLGCEAK